MRGHYFEHRLSCSCEIQVTSSQAPSPSISYFILFELIYSLNPCSLVTIMTPKPSSNRNLFHLDSISCIRDQCKRPLCKGEECTVVHSRLKVSSAVSRDTILLLPVTNVFLPFIYPSDPELNVHLMPPTSTMHPLRNGTHFYPRLAAVSCAKTVKMGYMRRIRTKQPLLHSPWNLLKLL